MLTALHRLQGATPRSYVDAARICDDVGVDQIVLNDHVAMGERTDLYPYGKFPMTPEEPWPEPLTLLAAIATVTDRVRLGTAVLIAPLRPAVLLAKTIATLDALSGGRVDLGVGVGWQREEYDAVNVPFDRRWSRLDDQLRACRALWRDLPATFHSETVNFDRLYCTPMPIQPRLPIWLGAKATPALARRIAEYGDGWSPLNTVPVEDLAAGATLIREAFIAADRNPATLGVRGGLLLKRDANGQLDVGRALEAVPRLVDAGVTLVSVAVGPGLRDMPGVRTLIEQLARAFQR
jgi:probable F420-dependent oxidoreductase